MATALITGAAGFIGFFAAKRLLNDRYRVVGLDCMSDYYDVTLKEARLAQLQSHNDFRHVVDKVKDSGLLMSLFKEERPEVVIHLAAQAGKTVQKRLKTDHQRPRTILTLAHPRLRSR